MGKAFARAGQTSEWQVQNLACPFGRLGCFRHDFQVLDEPSNAGAALASVNQTRKGPSLPLPILRHDSETNVLRENNAG